MFGNSKTFLKDLQHHFHQLRLSGSKIYKEEVRDRLDDPLATNFKC
jgi:hypothetical protein